MSKKSQRRVSKYSSLLRLLLLFSSSASSCRKVVPIYQRNLDSVLLRKVIAVPPFAKMRIYPLRLIRLYTANLLRGTCSRGRYLGYNLWPKRCWQLF